MNKIGNSMQIRWDDNTTTNEMIQNQIFIGTGSPILTNQIFIKIN